MRLTEFSILDYGPTDLRFDSPLQLRGFNLFYGPNEAGKSLMQDALLKLLLDEEAESSPSGTSDPLFVNINRINEYPEGYVRLALGEGNHKVPETGTLTARTEETPGVHSISPADFRNVFVVRNSLLEPSSAYGPDYYGSVTERLTGLRTSAMTSIRDELSDLGPLTNNTSAAKLSNDAGDDKLKDRYERAGELLEEVRQLRERAEDQDLVATEKELLRARHEYARIEDRLDTLNRAQKLQQYRQGREELDRFRDAGEELETYDAVNEDQYGAWEQKQRVIEEHEKTVEDREETLDELDEQLEDLEEPIRNRERRLSQFREVRETIRNEVEPLLEEARELKERLAENETLESLDRGAFALSGLALLGFLGVVYLGEVPGAQFYPPIFVGLTLLFGYRLYRVRQRRGRYEATIQSINNLLAPHDLGGDSLEALESNVGDFEERVEEVEDELTELQDERRNLKTRRDTLKEQVDQELQPELEAARRTIKEFREESGVDTLEEYRKRLHEKQELERILRDCKNSLVTRFGGEELGDQEQIDHWEESLRQRKSAVEEEPTEEYDEEVQQELEERRDDLREQIESLQKQRKGLQEDLRVLRGQLQDVLGPSGRSVPPCEDLSDLGFVEDTLEEFRTDVERRRKAALEAIEIFESMETEEREKIRDLFGTESDVARHFERITDGNFKSVNYDPKENAVHVRTPNDEVLAPEQLSGGTYDQLYFAIRLGLGESLLRGNPGFFLLDDPFIKSDAQRLDRQFELLEEIVDSGWQILYFSAKTEVLDRVQSMGNRSIFRKNEHF